MDVGESDLGLIRASRLREVSGQLEKRRVVQAPLALAGFAEWPQN
jgi:hypothetical protein